jgi:hypothetical protein
MSTAKKTLRGVTVHDPAKSFQGYTLVAPQGGYNAWLINNEGEVVHHWPLERHPCFFGRLLPNGNLIYQGREEKDIQGPVVEVKDANGDVISKLVLGGGEYIIEVDKDGKEVWNYQNALMNHDFFRMKNGNTMCLVYSEVPAELKRKVKGGLPESDDTPMWSDALIEVDADKNVVWEWKAWEHIDPIEDEYCPLMHRCEWTHGNTCTVLDNGDVLVSFRHIDTIGIVDRQTGDLKWKWGRGELAHQHEPVMLDNGNILVFDNGEHRRGSTKYCYSRVLDVNPKTNEIEWEYVADPPCSFFIGNHGGAERLPNGNTLITDANSGRLFEVTVEKEIVWEYSSPFYGTHAGQKLNPLLYRAYRYAADFPGLKGYDLDPEKYKWVNEVYGPKSLAS